MTAFRSLAGWRGDGPFGAWLTRIAVRIAIRRAQRRREVTWIDPTGGSSLIDRPGGPDPAITTLRAERAEGLRSAVSRLDEPYREVIALRFFAGLSAREAAAVMGKQEGTVRGLQFRAIAAMRRSLGVDDPEAIVADRSFRPAGDEPIGPSGIG